MATTQQAQAQATTAVATATKEIEYLSNGQTVKLSASIVRDYLTKGNGNVSNQDIVGFINICKYNGLNPFLNDAYLVKFGTQPAQMVVSKEALMKRAESNENYDGIEAGVIVKTKDGIVKQIEGSFFDSDETLIGAWAKVHRKDRRHPFVSTVRLEEYDKKQSIWNVSKSTMIRKVAIVQAMREAFPCQLGGMYTQEEQKIQDTTAEIVNTTPINDAIPEQQQAQQPEQTNDISKEVRQPEF